MVTGLEGGKKKMKNNKREMLLTSLVCLLPLFAGAALYPRLPETMATHWDFSGNANGWSSRAATVFGLPLFILALHLVCFYAESRETKKNRNPVLRTVLLWFCPAVSLLGGAVTLGTGLGYEMHISTVVPVFVGLLFLILGNYLPKIRQNRTMGIKLPWTLQSEENWTRTHRLSGFLWVLCGLVMIPLSLLRLWSGWLFGVLLAVMVLIPAVYSYALHRKGISLDFSNEIGIEIAAGSAGQGYRCLITGTRHIPNVVGGVGSGGQIPGRLENRRGRNRASLGDV